MTDGENSANEQIVAATATTPVADEQPEPTLSASNAREESKAESASASALSVPEAHGIFSLKSK